MHPGNRTAWTLAAAVVALAASFTAGAADALPDRAVGLAGIAMYLESGATGMVLGVVRGDQDVVVGLGETAKGNGREPDGRSLARLGSISKALAGKVLGGGRQPKARSA